MGNHAAGKAMGIAAEAVFAARPARISQKDALRILDVICEPWRGCDAEFEAEDPNDRRRVNPEYTFYTDFNAPLGKLIAAAFSPGKKWKLQPRTEGNNDDIEDSVWGRWDKVYRKFKARYELCEPGDGKAGLGTRKKEDKNDD